MKHGILTLELVAEGELDPVEGANLLRTAHGQLSRVDEIDLFQRIIDLPLPRDGAREGSVHLSSRVLREAKQILAERAFVQTALSVWGGPAAATDSFVQSFGFAGLEEFHRRRRSIITAVESRKGLSAEDWRTSVELARVAVSDDVNGALSEWPFVTPYTLAESETMLTALESRIG